MWLHQKKKTCHKVKRQLIAKEKMIVMCDKKMNAKTHIQRKKINYPLGT